MSPSQRAQTRQTRQKPRTCAACRAEAPKQALARIVRTPGGEAVFDPTGKLPGRGAYLCLNRECLERARKTGALSRALKISIPDSCWEELAGALERGAANAGDPRRELCSLLGMARRANLLTLGMDAIKSRAVGEKREALLLLTAKDASEPVRDFAENLAEASRDRKHGSVHLTLPLDVEELSAALGAGRVQIAALAERSGLSDKLKMLL